METLPFEAGDPLDLPARFRALQQRQPVTRARTIAGDTAWLVTRYADVMSLFNDDRLSRSHPDPQRAARVSGSLLLGGPTGTPQTEQANHRRMRTLLAPAFSARRMNILRHRIGVLVDGLLDDLTEPPADLHHALSVPLPVMVICELLGAPYRDHKRFREWAASLVSLTDTTASAQALSDFVAYMRQLITAKRTRPGTDLISDLLIAAHQDPTLTDEVIARMAAMVLFAGHETTVNRIDLGVLLLLRERDCWDMLRTDPALLDSTVEEILRLSTLSTTGGLPRYAHADIALGDTTIQAGDAVLLATSAANRDPRVFPDPDAFDPARAPNPHLAFGHGPRYCIGAGLARIELQEVFRRLPRHFPQLQLAVPHDQLHFHSNRLTGGIADLPITWPNPPPPA